VTLPAGLDMPRYGSMPASAALSLRKARVEVESFPDGRVRREAVTGSYRDQALAAGDQVSVRAAGRPRS